jgi:hypothetical protein
MTLSQALEAPINANPRRAIISRYFLPQRQTAFPLGIRLPLEVDPILTIPRSAVLGVDRTSPFIVVRLAEFIPILFE